MPPDNVVKARTNALDVNRVHQGAPPTGVHSKPQTPLSDLLKDPTATWQFSNSGGGGASMVKSTSATGGGAAIKIEHDLNAVNAERCGALMEEFFKRAQGPQPFVAPRVRTYKQSYFSKNTGEKDELDRRLDAEKTTDLDRPHRVDDHKNNLASIITKDDHAVFVMEFGSGKPLSSLSTAEKEALLRSSEFAQSIGRALVPCVALGLKDHLGTPANPSNVLYDTATGTLSFIDYDAGQAISKNGHVMVGSNNKAPDQLAEMRTFLENATKSPDDFQKAIDVLLDPTLDSPFHNAFHCMMKRGSDHGEYLFTPGDDVNAPTDVNVMEKRDFAASFLKGAVDGLAYLETNRQALKQAATAIHETKPDGTKLEHFYDQAKLDRFDHEMDQFDITGLQKNMKNMLDHREQNLDQEFQRMVDKQKRVDDLQQQMDRRQNRPTPWERIKDTFNIGNAIGRMDTERRQLERQLGIPRMKNSPPANLGDKADWVDFHQKQSGTQATAPQAKVTGSPQQSVTLNQPTVTQPPVTTGRTDLTTARGPSQQSPSPTTTQSQSGPKKDELLDYVGPNATKSLPPLPQVPDQQLNQGETPKTSKDTTQQPKPKVRDVVGSPPPDKNGPTKVQQSQNKL